MALGVLNNLSAIYAENNLNNTNNSLQTVLQQLSSGSKINSGADDAAGLSLVNGLQANQTALTQSETNATEGVGLLQVADGAMSQVTSLLDRAVTLATEASNGTLNSTQEGAANQEYQSILAEVNNIGSTTTYNQEQVFAGNTIAIYTGDSSMAGSSIDDLHIRTMSSSSLGDTDGVMSYSSGQDNVFIDLSNSGHNAAVSDSLNASGATTVDVSYMTKGAGGAATTATAAISVGAGTSYANTAQGLISAINNAGLGLTATFGTATAAGAAAVTTAAASNNGGGSGTDTGIIVSGSGIGAGTANTGIVGALSLVKGDTLGGTLSIVGSDGINHNITLGTANSTDTLANLESTINSGDYGVTAALNAEGTQLTFTTDDPSVTVSASNLTENSAGSSQTTTVTDAGLGSLTVGSTADTLTGTLNIQEGSDGLNTATSLNLAGKTISQLMTAIDGDSAYGITATLNTQAVDGQAAGTVLTFTKSANDRGTAAISGANVTDVASPAIATGGTLGSLTVASAGDTLGVGSLTIKSGTTGLTSVLTLGSAADGTDTLANLAQTIDNGNYGITATLDATGTILTFTQTGGTATAAITGSGKDNTYTQTPIAIVAGQTLGAITLAGPNDTIAGGTLAITSDAGVVEAPLAMAGETLANLVTYFNVTHPAYGITAALSNGGDTLTFTDTGGIGDALIAESDTVGGTPPTDTTPAHNATTAVVITAGETLGSLSVANAEESLAAGSLTITSGITGGVSALALGTPGTTDTLANLAHSINTGGYGITATLDSTDTDLTFTQNNGDTFTAGVTSNAITEDPVVTPGSTLGSLSANKADDTLTGTFSIQEGVDGKNTASTLNFTGQTLAQIAQTIDSGDYGITATLNSAVGAVAAGTVLTFTQNTSDKGTAGITNVGVITDNEAAVTNTPVNVTNPGGGNLGTLTVAANGDMLTGSLSIVEGIDTNGTQSTYNFTGQTLQEIAASFDQPPDEQNDNTGITATLANNNTELIFTKTGTDPGPANPSVSGLGITDITPASTTNQEVTTGTILNTITVANSSDLVSGDIDFVEGADGLNTPTNNFALGGKTIAAIAAEFDTGAESADGITATVNGDTLTFSQTLGDLGIANVTPDGALTDQIQSSSVDQTLGQPTILNSLTVAAAGDFLNGTLTIQEGADAAKTTSTYNLAGQTIAEIVTAFTTGAEANLGITATASNGGKTLTFSQTPGDLGTANVTASTTVDDSTLAAQTQVTVASGTMLDTLSVNGAGDKLGGALNLTSGISGNVSNLVLGTLGSTDTLAHLAQTINAGGYGITATLNAAGTELSFTQNNGDGFNAAVSGASITDSESTSVASSANLGTLTVNTASDTLSGALTGVESDGKTPYTINLGISGSTDTLQDLAHTINVTDATYGITATLNPAGTSLTFTATNGDSGTPTLGNEGNLTDTTPAVETPISLTETPTTGLPDSTTLGTLSILSTDTLTGSLDIGDNILGIGATDNTAATLAAAINKGAYGVAATYDSSDNRLTFTSPNSSMAVNTGNLDATVLNGSTAVGVGPLIGPPYTASSYYSIGVSGDITDTSTAVAVGNATTYGGTANVGIAADFNGAGGTATMSYSDSAGQSLSGTDLLNQTDAESALNELNVAITDVSAQDGYIGAQINTLNSVSQVMTTQQENVVSAQNAIQATDYASATSDMSKYEILSQTGIAALAQANSVQQEVTKLLQ